MNEPVPSKSGLKVLRDLLSPDWRLRDNYIRSGYYVMQWKSWPDSREYRPSPDVVKHLVRWGYVTPLLKDGKKTDWYILTDAGRVLVEKLPAKLRDSL